MNKRKKEHRYELPKLIRRYAAARKLEDRRINEYQYRLSDPKLTTIDIWTTGKYFIVKTSYHKITHKSGITERQGERGTLPIPKIEVGRFLDRVFFSGDVLEER